MGGEGVLELGGAGGVPPPPAQNTGMLQLLRKAFGDVTTTFNNKESLLDNTKHLRV